MWMRTSNLIICFLRALLNLVKVKDDKETIVVLARSDNKEREIISRLRFYEPEMEFETLRCGDGTKASLAEIISSKTYLAGDDGYFSPLVMRFREGIFNVDYEKNHNDGWEWHSFLNRHGNKMEHIFQASHHRFSAFVERMRQEAHPVSCIFGTGPSLFTASDKDWSGTYRVVCNTIVRDAALWKHIKPHICVAGDAIYHFGHTSFARAFCRDLSDRLRESETLFVYPAFFHTFVEREFKEFRDRLVPVPIGEHKRLDTNLIREFSLPSIGNVLALLLLPIACTLSKRVLMLGFDGRAPDDKLFWSNSSTHSYPEHMNELCEAHPAFFAHYVPASEPNRYVKQVHGDVLDNLLIEAEKRGWLFEMLHMSWTPTLQKRYRPDSWTALPSSGYRSGKGDI